MLAKTKILLSTVTLPIIACPAVLEYERSQNNGLTNKEVEEGYFIDPVLGKCNVKKAMQQRAEAIRREYEAFDNMHRADGIVDNKCLRIL